MQNKQEMKVWRKAEGTYRISSETTEGTYYKVIHKNSVWLCSCPHFVERHIEECKHIRKVKQLLRKEIEYEEMEARGVDPYIDDNGQGIIDETYLAYLHNRIGEAQRELWNIWDYIRKLKHRQEEKEREGIMPSQES